VLSDPDYGKLSHRRLDEMRAGARIEADERKEHPMDFALWKASKPGEPSWESPWGPGRPGWHIECTTMALRKLGDQIDIHGGGNDLIFPHHENEIAQSEQLTGKRPFARYWMHNGMLQFADEKMSKSLGNVLSIQQVVDRYGADAYRWFVLSSHYRRPISFSVEALEAAERAVHRVATAARLGTEDGAADSAESYRAEFEAAMDDDFNTARALAVLQELARSANSAVSQGQPAAPQIELLRELSGVLGLTLERHDEPDGDVAPLIDLLLEVRSELRSAKRFDLSDLIRDRLAALGIEVRDSAQGSTWERSR
ncbi:MAG: class I tRNA ligase family protein, partial [Chloroflexota bacterium]|nr:class I tRNA ligase family protein [Chloroflexota bacterium]